MHRALQLGRQDLIDQALTLDAAEAREPRRNDFDPEMSFALGPGAGMAGMAMGFVDHRKPRGR